MGFTLKLVNKKAVKKKKKKEKVLPKTKAERKSKIKKHGGSVVLHSSPSLLSHHSPADAANGFFSNYTFAFTNKLLA